MNIHPLPAHPPGGTARMLPTWLAVLMLAGLVPVVLLAAPAGTAAAMEPEPATEQAGPAQPVAAMGVDGLNLFIRRAGGDLWRRTQNADGRWDNWVNTRATGHGSPALGSILKNQLMVFVRGDDNQLWRQTQNAKGTWSQWQSLGAPPGVVFDSDPAVAVNDNRAANAVRGRLTGSLGDNTDGRLEVFIRDTEGRLWHRAQRAVGDSAWTPWERMAGFAGRLTGDPVAVVGGDGRIALFARDGAGYVRHSAQVSPGRPGLGDQPHAKWSPWQRITQQAVVRAGDDIAVAVNTVEKFGTLLQVFANGSGGKLWTITQSVAGNAADPGGKWARVEVLRAAFASSPVVAAGPDGRLHLFGLRAGDNRVAYRSQVSPVYPYDPDHPQLTPDPNGNWYACCTTWARGPVMLEMTVVDTGGGRLEMFGIRGGDGSVLHRRQLSGGSPQSPPGTWHDFANLNPVAQPCANQGTLSCFAITSPHHDGTILDGSPNYWDGVMHVAATGAATGHQRWQAVPAGGDGTFQVKNLETGRCLENASDGYAKTFPCDGSQARQQWYLRAVGTDEPAPASLYQLVSTTASDQCVTAIPGGEVWTDRCEYWEDADSHLLLGMRGERAPGIMDLAIEYVAGRCDPDDSSVNCEWVEDPSRTGPAYHAGAACVASQVVYNSSDTDSARLKVISHRMTGVDFGVSATIEAAPWGIGVSFTASVDWVQEDTAGTEFEFGVPPGRFGWAVQQPVMRSSVGHWEFTVDGKSWSVPGEVAAYAKDGTDNVRASNVASVTSTSPPTIGRCPGA